MESQIKITRLQEQVKAIKEEVTQTRAEMKEGFTRLENKLDCYVPKVQYEADIKTLNERIGTVKGEAQNSTSWREWVIRLVMGGVIGALLALVLKGI